MFDINFFQKVTPFKQKIIEGDFLRSDAEEIEKELETFRTKKPQVFNIETTNYCNMKCIMCPRTDLMTRKNIWIDDIGVPAKRIQKGDKDNFWHMNIPGPCGPCSEIFIDRGPKYGKGGGPINGGEDRYIEIWNLVFMQYIQDKPYNVVGDLPAKNVDTGMGLERVAMILQDKKTIFETDLFKPIIDSIEKIHSIKYGENDKSDKHIRIISDHIRSTTFLLSDGVVPTLSLIRI